MFLRCISCHHSCHNLPKNYDTEHIPFGFLKMFANENPPVYVEMTKQADFVCGGGEAEGNSVMVFEDVKDLKHLPPMYAVGDDMLTGVYLIGKATLRMMYCGEAEV